MYPEQLLTPHLSQEALYPSLCAMEARSQYKRGLWTAEEDQILMDYIRVYGNGRWNRVAKITGLKRCGKSCRLRWINYLSPNVKKGNFTQEEEDLIIRLHRLLGNRWSLIAGRVPGRTDNQVKNHWNTHLSKKLGMKRRQRKYRPSTPTTSRNHQIKAEGNMVCQDSDANKFEAYDSGDGTLGLDDYSHNIVESVNNTELISGEYAVDSSWFADSDVTHSSLMELREMLPLEMLWKNL